MTIEPCPNCAAPWTQRSTCRLCGYREAPNGQRRDHVAFHNARVVPLPPAWGGVPPTRHWPKGHPLHRADPRALSVLTTAGG